MNRWDDHARLGETGTSEGEASSDAVAVRAEGVARLGYLPIDRQHIEGWLQRADVRYELPRLVRLLIHETTPGLSGLYMPAGTGVDAPGWDGIGCSAERTAWVPEGLSLWELSATSAPRGKAREDYGKRDSTPDGSPTTSAVYVGLYPHREWSRPARESWMAEGRADGKWRDVVAYGLDELEDWLAQAPVTRAWFADHLGLHPGGYRAARDWWRDWASLTSPALPPEFLIAGRDEQARELLQRLAGEPVVTTVRAESADEVAAFVVAAVLSEDHSDKGLLARTAVVDDIDSWRALLGWRSPLILVPTRRELVNDLRVDNRHHVVVAALGAEGDLRLPRIDARGAKEALEGAGMNAVEAEETGRLARRCLMAARIRLARSRELLLPGWAQAPAPRPVRAVLLAGFWSHAADGDREVLAELAGEDHETLNERLEQLGRDRCPLAMRADRAWHLVSVVDAWEMLRSTITVDDLERLESAVQQVLGERDGSLDFSPDERWMGSVLGRTRSYSSELREGLARSLAFLALHGEDVSGTGRADGAGWASALVRGVLPPADSPEGIDAWLSLRDVLPTLAEAAPGVFLDALESTLQTGDPHPSPVVVSLHTTIVRSLERIAWCEDYFARVIYALAALHEGLAGENAETTAMQKLVGMFFPWRPISSVPQEARLQVLDGLHVRHPDCAWQLMMNLLKPDVLVMETERPLFRDWATEHATLTRTDRAAFTSEIARHAAKTVGTDSGRVVEVVMSLERLAPGAAESMLGAVESAVKQRDWPDEERAKVSKAVHGIIPRARSRGESYTVLSEPQLCRLEAVASTLESPDAVERHVWLFEEWFPRIEGSSIQDGFELHESRVNEARRDAMSDIYNASGLSGVLRLASEPSVGERDCRHFVSRALADLLGAEADGELRQMLAEDRSHHERDLAFEYFARRFRMEGWAWFDQLLERGDLTDYQRARLLGATRDYPRAWQTAENAAGAVAGIFWAHFVPYGLGHDFAHVEFVAKRLLDAGRPQAAITLLATYTNEASIAGSEQAAQLAARAVSELAESSEGLVAGAHLEYDLQNLFELMNRHRASVGDDTIAALEWQYLPALGFEPTATGLHRRMAADPQFFVELVCSLYRPRHRAAEDDASMEPPDAQTRQQIERTHRLLKSWQHPPGLGDDGSIDPTALRDWIAEARRLLRDADRAEVGEQCIGQILWAAPEGSDGIKPGTAIRELLEELCSNQIETGLRLAIVNSRGATCRAPDAGGDQERQSAAEYHRQADQLKYQWPRTASILTDVARSYEHHARWEDEEAERVRTGIER